MRTKARLTETTHANFNSAYRSYRRASTRLTAAITGEPQLGLQKLSGEPQLGLQNSQASLSSAYRTLSGEPQLGLQNSHRRASARLTELSQASLKTRLTEAFTGEPELGLQKQHMRIPIRLTEATTGESQLGLQRLSQASLSSAYRN